MAKIDISSKLSVAKQPSNRTSVRTKSTAIPEEVPEFIPEGYRFDLVDYRKLKNADEQWNFFSKPSDAKISDLALSINQNGLLQPIIVREIDDADYKYEILAGHTRKAAYEMLYKSTGDSKWLYIKAIIYDKGKLSDLDAKEIIVDTNFFNRGNLPPGDMAKCIKYKAQCIKDNSRYGSGSVAEKIAEKYKISKSSVTQWQAIARLSDQLLQLFNEKKISLKNAYKLSVLTQEQQAVLYNECKESISNKAVEAVKLDWPVNITKLTADINAYVAPKGLAIYSKTYEKKKLSRKKGDLTLVFVNKDCREELAQILKEKGLGFILE